MHIYIHIIHIYVYMYVCIKRLYCLIVSFYYITSPWKHLYHVKLVYLYLRLIRRENKHCYIFLLCHKNIVSLFYICTAGKKRIELCHILKSILVLLQLFCFLVHCFIYFFHIIRLINI